MATRSTKSQSGHNASTLGQNNQVVIIQKGEFFSELERLKCLDNHRQRLERIQSKDTRKAVRDSVDRHDPRKSDADKKRRMDYLQ